MRRLLALSLVAATSAAALADFTVANWTFSNGGGGGTGALTPTQMDIFGNNSGGSGIKTTYSSTSEAGNVSFNWSYDSTDTSTWDYGYYAINGVETVLAYNNTQGSGSIGPIVINPGDTLTFGVHSVDGAIGAGNLHITKYVPEPTSLVLLALGALAAIRRR